MLEPKDWRDFLESFASRELTYHNQKEQMATAAATLYCTGAVALSASAPLAPVVMDR